MNDSTEHEPTPDRPQFTDDRIRAEIAEDLRRAERFAEALNSLYRQLP